MSLKPRVKSAAILSLRVLGLLELTDLALYGQRRLRSWPRNRRFKREHPDFPTPPAHLAFDALNHAEWSTYRDSGKVHARLFAGIIGGTFPSGPLSILEWGCGPGRLIRHLRDALPGRDVKLTGSDYNHESIAWCRANLPGIQFIENGLMPPLDAPDASFDVAYTFSVFTHLSEQAQLAWAAELHRVLKPGGLLICTTHGDRHRFLLASPSDRQRYDAGEVVVKGNYREGRKWFLAFHPPAFVRGRLLGRFTDVRELEVGEDHQLTQVVWTARKEGPRAK